MVAAQSARGGHRMRVVHTMPAVHSATYRRWISDKSCHPEEFRRVAHAHQNPQNCLARRHLHRDGRAVGRSRDRCRRRGIPRPSSRHGGRSESISGCRSPRDPTRSVSGRSTSPIRRGSMMRPGGRASCRSASGTRHASTATGRQLRTRPHSFKALSRTRSVRRQARSTSTLTRRRTPRHGETFAASSWRSPAAAPSLRSRPG